MKEPSPVQEQKNVKPEKKTTLLFQRPASVKTPRIEQTEWGSRLPDRPYFPMPLGNGVDAMMINLSGSGEMHWERPLRSSNPLTRLLNTEWYRADRRDHSCSDSVYGQLMPFVDFSASPMIRGDFMVPREVKQFFDPRTATLTTFFSQLDNRTEEPLELRIHTFLTHDGVLVQSARCITAPRVGAQYSFTMSEPGPDYQNVRIPIARPADTRFEQNPEDPNLVDYSSTWEQGRAVGFSLVGGVAVTEVKKGADRLPPCRQVDQFTAIFHTGDTVWRAMAIQDDREGGDPSRRCAELLKKIRSVGVEGLHSEHCAAWEEYFSTSSVTLPDPAAQFLYDVSRYIVKANLHPCGFLPMGNFPYLWQGAMFWDASFGHQMLLGCGNFAEAASITRHFISLEKHGRALAERMNSQGIRIEWTVNLFDFSTYDPPLLQIHNNAVWAWAFLLEYRYTGNIPDQKTLGFVRELLLFLVDRLVQRDACGPEEPIVGIDESYRDPKPNDTWSIAVCLKALTEYSSLCAESGMDPDIADSEAACDRLRLLLAGNADAEGILQSFSGGKLPHWGSLVFDLYPDAPEAAPTLAKMSRNYYPEFDLFNFHGLTRYAERAFPWSNNWAARCLARIRRPEALHYWLNNTRSTNIFGGVPERVYYHGENYINWCMTAHAAQVWAMNAMLVDFRDGVLTLLGGIDTKIWRDLEFENIRTERGLSVSLRMESGKISCLSIASSSRNPRTLTLSIPAISLEKEIFLAEGTSSLTSILD